MDLNATLAFVHVIRTGSFSGAARSLALPASTVSDRIASLERALGVTLIVRTTRKLKLTDAGAKYFEKAETALTLLESANEEVNTFQQKPSGKIRITTPNEFAPSALAEAIVDYQKKFPDVKVEAYLTNRYVDLVGEGFDLAIRGGELADSSLVSKTVGKDHFILISSEKYLKSAPPLRHPKDLADHSCIGFLGHDLSKEEFAWTVQSTEGPRFKCKPKFTASATSFSVVIELIKSGAGVALVPQIYVTGELKQKTITRVLPKWGTSFSAVHLLYPQQKFSSPKVREMIPLIENRLRRVLESEA